MSKAYIDIAERNPAQPKGFALFDYGFRPFFLLSGLYAVLAIILWLAVLIGGMWPASGPAPALWHMHEMLFGFVGAAIGGFLLTAVPNWTGQRGFAGKPLILLVVIWLAGRLALNPLLPLPAAAAAALDLAFFPALAGVILPSLIKSGNVRNMPFLLMIALLFTGNLLFHLDLWDTGIRLTMNTVLLLVSVIGGRIIPSFTLSALRRRGTPINIAPMPWIERMAIGLTVAVLVLDLLQPDHFVAGWVALAAALAHGIRLVRWQGWRSLGEPILWVLHLGYAWLPAGLALKAAWLLTGAEFASAWVHALTIGCFGTLILAVMSRASLGHTGRELVASRPTTVAYVLVTLAALTRVLGPALGPDTASYGIAGALWIASFTLFVVVYATILIRPRPDGRSG